MKNLVLEKSFIEGFVQELILDDYQNTLGLNQIALKNFIKNTTSWKLIKNTKEHQLRENAGYYLLLEQKRFQTSFVQGPERQGQKEDSVKGHWTEFQRQNSGKNIIPANLRDQLNKEHSPIKILPQIYEWMLSGDSENSVFWFDDLNHNRCKVILDWYNEELGIILYPKFTSFDSPSECKRRIVLLRYDLQAGWYSRSIYFTATKPQFVIVFTESSRPYRILPLRLSSEDIQRGEHKINQAFDLVFDTG